VATEWETLEGKPVRRGYSGEKPEGRSCRKRGTVDLPAGEKVPGENQKITRQEVQGVIYSVYVCETLKEKPGKRACDKPPVGGSLKGDAIERKSPATHPRA
jgi:hypothetical protein